MTNSLLQKRDSLLRLISGYVVLYQESENGRLEMLENDLLDAVWLKRVQARDHPFRWNQLGDPGSSYNLQSLGAFGRFGGIGRGSFSDIGTSRMHHIIVGRVEW